MLKLLNDFDEKISKMGGRGSGHWYRWDKRQVVEDCLILNLSFFLKNKFLRHDAYKQGSIKWGEKPSQWPVLEYELCTISTQRPYVRLHYSISKAHSPKEFLDYQIPLTVTYLKLGGIRWWFRCPLAKCNRRVLNLYIPPGSKHFGCRQCYNLAYASQQEREGWRLLRQAEKIYKKLGCMGVEIDIDPPKPKGMWQRTYLQLLDEGKSAYYQSLYSLM